MQFTIRHFVPDDLEAVHEIMLSHVTIVGTMRLPYQSLNHTRSRMEPADGVIKLVAIAEEAIVGFAELVTSPNVPRHRHVGEINMIATHEDWQGKGVGRALMSAMIDLGDNWLQLTRLYLTVWTTNRPAITLYEKLGFEVEGTMPDFAFGEG